VENSALQHVLYVLSFLSKTLQGASANPHGHATTHLAGWHHNIAEFAAADGEKGVLTDLCLTPVLTDLCLTCIII
jgi:hypothetical protein